MEKITSVKEVEIIENGLISETEKKKTGQHKELREFKTSGGKG